MRRSVRFILLLCYYAAKLLGVLRFSYDFNTRRVTTSAAITLYAAAINVSFLIALPLLYKSRLYTVMVKSSTDLHRCLYAAMMLLRILAVTTTLVYNWLKRGEFMAVLRSFQRLQRCYFERHPVPAALQQRFERSLLRKFLLGCLMETAMSLAVLDSFRDILDWPLYGNYCMVTIYSGLLNMVLNSYFLAMQTVSLHLHVLNDKLVGILRAARLASRSRRQRPGFYSLSCCQLADELDEVALMYRRVQRLFDRIQRMYGIQCTAIMLHVYFNNVGWVYKMYVLLKGRFEMQLTVPGMCSLVIGLVAYYADVLEYVRAMDKPLGLSADCIGILRRQRAFHLLDARLEKSIESFSLQMTGNPFRIPPMGLFNVDRKMIFSVLGSTITHVIVIVQIDYKHY